MISIISSSSLVLTLLLIGSIILWFAMRVRRSFDDSKSRKYVDRFHENLKYFVLAVAFQSVSIATANILAIRVSAIALSSYFLLMGLVIGIRQIRNI